MFDRFDIVEAHYCFLVEFHEGQGSEKYRRLCHILGYFKPRPSLSSNTLSENAREIYYALVEKEMTR